MIFRPSAKKAALPEERMMLFAFGKTKNECFYLQNWSASVCHRLLKSDNPGISRINVLLKQEIFREKSVFFVFCYPSPIFLLCYPSPIFQCCYPSPIFPFTEFPTFFPHTLRSHKIWISVFYFEPLVVVCWHPPQVS